MNYTLDCTIHRKKTTERTRNKLIITNIDENNIARNLEKVRGKERDSSRSSIILCISDPI